MISLGISAFYHDSAACIFKDGKVLAAIEEEKLTNIKHDSSFPVKSIAWLLTYCNLTIDDINIVCWYELPDIKYDRVKKTLGKRCIRNWKTWKKFKKEFGETEGNLPTFLTQTIGYTGDIQYVDHHLSHIALSHYTSPFNKATAVSVDGVGEWQTALVARCSNNNIVEINSITFPNSFGLLYSSITAYLGFKPNNGEYKVMGLAPYGDATKYQRVFQTICKFSYINTIEIDQKYFTWEYSNKDMYTYELVKLIGFDPREPESKIEQHHMDLAAALQAWYELWFYYFVNQSMRGQYATNLELGGGSAYNGTANGKLKKYTTAKSVWIPFAPSDAGSSIGACLYHWHNILNHPKIDGGDNQSPFLGPEFSEAEIEVALTNVLNIQPTKLSTEELLATTAKLINDGNVIGWFQGRTEFGARALGNRSILANPHIADVRDRINRVIKKREMFRPFAPSVTVEDYETYFDSEGEVPYMNQVVQVKTTKAIPSVTHVDNSARIQTVRRADNPLYYDLLKAFEKVSGTPILLNTSFNLRGHTITNDPYKAIWTFLNSDMDYLILGNYLISKSI